MFSEEIYENILIFFHFSPWFATYREPQAPNSDKNTYGTIFKGQFRFHPTIFSQLFKFTGQLVSFCEHKYEKYYIFCLHFLFAIIGTHRPQTVIKTLMVLV